MFIDAHHRSHYDIIHIRQATEDLPPTKKKIETRKCREFALRKYRTQILSIISTLVIDTH